MRLFFLVQLGWLKDPPDNGGKLPSSIGFLQINGLQGRSKKVGHDISYTWKTCCVCEQSPMIYQDDSLCFVQENALKQYLYILYYICIYLLRLKWYLIDGQNLAIWVDHCKNNTTHEFTLPLKLTMVHTRFLLGRAKADFSGAFTCC